MKDEERRDGEPDAGELLGHPPRGPRRLEDLPRRDSLACTFDELVETRFPYGEVDQQRSHPEWPLRRA